MITSLRVVLGIGLAFLNHPHAARLYSVKMAGTKGYSKRFPGKAFPCKAVLRGFIAKDTGVGTRVCGPAILACKHCD